MIFNHSCLITCAYSLISILEAVFRTFYAMIPLRDDNPTRTFPFVTIALIAVNALVFFVQKTTPGFESIFSMVPREITAGHGLVGLVYVGSQGTSFQPLPMVGGQYVFPTSLPPNVIVLLPPPQPVWLTIFTAMFMHANLLHIGGNMLFLWIFGNNVEDALGKLRFLFFYLACGVAAAFAQIATDPNSLIPTLGASGAIAGVLAAYIVMYPTARVLTAFVFVFIFLREIPAFWMIGIWIALQVIQA